MRVPVRFEKGPMCFSEVQSVNAIKPTATVWMPTGPYPAVLGDTWVSRKEEDAARHRQEKREATRLGKLQSHTEV